MSDATDYQQNQLEAQNYGIWNPQTKTNVSLIGSDISQSPTQYIQAHPDVYKGYTGEVNHFQDLGVHPEAYGFNTGTRSGTGADYRNSYEQARLNPYDTSAQDRFSQFQTKAYQNTRVLPGVRPNLGYIPGFGAVDMNRGLRPTAWDQYDSGPKSGIDPVEARMLQMASDRNMNFPRIADVYKGKGQIPNFGRGFVYGGTPSAEEQQLTNAFLNGQPVNMNRLAQLRSARIEQKKLSDIQELARKYYYPLLMSIGSIPIGGIGGWAGPVTGAAFGTFNAGVQSKFKNPAALVAGGAGGLLGGWGGGQLGNTLGAGPVVTGAMSGFGSAAGREIGTNAVTGKWDPNNIARNIIMSTAAGATSGAFKPPGELPPGVQGPPTPPGPTNFLGGFPGQVLANQFGSGVSQLVGSAWDPTQVSNPQDDINRRRRAQQLQQQRRLNPYSR